MRESQPIVQVRNSDIQLNGKRLHVQRISVNSEPAADQRPTLVFLHEGLGCVSQWRDFPQRLASLVGCHAMVYDRLGHGRSDPLTRPHPLDFLSREALDTFPELLHHCGISETILIGHCDGGSIALIYAAHYPEKVRGLITEAAHVFVDHLTIQGIRRAEQAFRRGTLAEKLARHHGENANAMFHAWKNVWLDPAYREWNIESCLPEISCPVLAIQGQNDPYGIQDQLERIVNQVATPADALWIPECGHMPHRDAEELVLGKMASFITELLQSP